MALTHHMVVRVCHHLVSIEEGKKIPLDYAILGDDLVIGDETLARKYQYIMVEVMGVKIS